MRPDYECIFPQAGGSALITPDKDNHGLIAYTTTARIDVPLTPGDMRSIAACLFEMAEKQEQK